MCGRFALYSSFQVIKDYADLLCKIDDLEANYNAAPGQNIPVIYQNGLSTLRWGLIPFWAKDEKIGYKLINVRAETIDEKFKYAFQKRRCLILANGFYEWNKKDKQPFYFFLKERELFTFAGIWEMWKSPEGNIIKTCSIITTEPNNIVKPIHSRMPVILSGSNEKKWLEANDDNSLIKLLKPYSAQEMNYFAVSKEIGSVKNNYPELIKAI